MNIQMQTGGVFILLLLLYFYKRQDTVDLYTGKVFLRALYITLACLILDILSIVLIVNQSHLPTWLVKAECKAYLVSLVVTGYIAFAYASADIHHLVKSDTFTRWLGLAVIAVAVLIFALPISTYYNGQNVVYTYGWACSATYAGALLLIMATLIKIFFARESNESQTPQCDPVVDDHMDCGSSDTVLKRQAFVSWFRKRFGNRDLIF